MRLTTRMHTQCPRCQTVFDVSQQQLETAAGIVCCGQCQQIFKASHYADETVPYHPDLFENIPPHQSLIPPEKTNPAQENLVAPTPILPDINTLRQQPHTGHKIFWWTGNILLITLLAALLSYINRNKLAENPQLKPYIQAACQRIPDCIITTRRDITRLELVSRNVYTHPNIPAALMIGAVLINNAEFIQPYPVLLVTLSSVHGHIVAQRHFQPGEYLNPHARLETGMPVNTPITISLEVMDPGNNALAFELDFL